MWYQLPNWNWQVDIMANFLIKPKRVSFWKFADLEIASLLKRARIRTTTSCEPNYNARPQVTFANNLWSKAFICINKILHDKLSLVFNGMFLDKKTFIANRRSFASLAAAAAFFPKQNFLGNGKNKTPWRQKVNPRSWKQKQDKSYSGEKKQQQKLSSLMTTGRRCRQFSFIPCFITQGGKKSFLLFFFQHPSILFSILVSSCRMHIQSHWANKVKEQSLLYTLNTLPYHYEYFWSIWLKLIGLGKKIWKCYHTRSEPNSCASTH